MGPMYAAFDPRDPRCDPVYAYCQKNGLPILFHVGTTFNSAAPLRFTRPWLFDEVAIRYPELRMVLAHVGHPFSDECLVVIRKHPHVYADISALYYRPWQFYNTLIIAQEYKVTHKLLFGTDYPFAGGQASIDGLRNVNHIIGEQRPAPRHRRDHRRHPAPRCPASPGNRPMKALQFQAIEQVALIDVDPPTIGDDELLIKTGAAVICTSDLNDLRENAFGIQLPVIMGHEGAGTVAAVGAAGHAVLQVGDRVTTHPVHPCGQCVNCRNGMGHLCLDMGHFALNRPGVFAEYFPVRADRARHIPDTMPFTVAALAEPVSVCLEALNQANLSPGRQPADHRRRPLRRAHRPAGPGSAAGESGDRRAP